MSYWQKKVAASKQMNTGLTLYLLMILIGAISALLASVVFFKTSFAKTHGVKLTATVLTIMALGITLYQTFVRPPLPEPLAECEISSPTAPTTITCTNRSENYSHIEWSFEDGRVIAGGEAIQRQVDKPGTYKIVLKAYGKWPRTEIARSFPSAFVVEAEQSHEPEMKTVVRHISSSNKGAGTRYETISADPGFRIVDATLRVTSSSGADAHIETRSDSAVRIRVNFQPKVSIHGFLPVVSPSWLNGDLVMALEKLGK
jgi:hypothetical protein